MKSAGLLYAVRHRCVWQALCFNSTGKTQFFEADSIAFHRLWQDENEPIVNGVGDEVKTAATRNQPLADLCAGGYTRVLFTSAQFFLSAGKHTITLRFVSEDIAMAICFCGLLPNWNPIKPSETETGEPVYFEAEKECC